MKSGTIRFLEALAKNMPPLTHATKKKYNGAWLKKAFPDLLDVDGKEIKEDQGYLCDIEEPVDSLRLLKGVYTKTKGNKEASVVEAVFRAKQTQNDKILHKTIDGTIIKSATVIK